MPEDSVIITALPIRPELLANRLRHDANAGACVIFEGWVRQYNEGKKVKDLTYESHTSMSIKEIYKIIQEAKLKFKIDHILVSHRIGKCHIGDIAVWIGVIGEHRSPCYQASEYVIHELKHRAPIWKLESYDNGETHWIGCSS